MAYGEKRVLITGVSSGLGKALAFSYLQQGWHVFGLSRRVPGDLVGKSRFSFVSVDLADFQSVALGIRELVNVSSLDLVILNAGMLGQFGDLADSSLETLHEVMDVNVWANKVIVDFLILEGIAVKQVVAISSGASISGSRGWNGYGISKAALNMLIKLYAAEQEKIHFCALAPGLVDSSMQEYLSTIKDTENYPTLQRIQATRNTSAMQAPEVAAEKIIHAIARLPQLVKSGEYADIRTL